MYLNLSLEFETVGKDNYIFPMELKTKGNILSMSANAPCH
jgi:hypothetical protein